LREGQRKRERKKERERERERKRKREKERESETFSSNDPFINFLFFKAMEHDTRHRL
jgi:hypothetical protein